MEKFLVQAGNGMKLVNVHSRARENEFTAQGQVFLGLGRHSMAAAESVVSTSAWWCKAISTSMEHVWYSEPYIPGQIKINARQVIIEAIRGRPVWLAPERLELVQGRECQLQYVWVDESFKSSFVSVDGPGPGLIALVGVGAAVATCGAASTWAASASGVAQAQAANLIATKGMLLTEAMLKASYISLCSQASMALVANNGDLGRAVTGLARSNTVVGLASTMITAGIMHQVNGALGLKNNIDTRTFTQHMQHAIAHVSVNASMSMLLSGAKMSFNQALLNVVANTIVDATLANTNQAGTLNEVHKKRCLYGCWCY